jgi:putative oxidoreductase
MQMTDQSSKRTSKSAPNNRGFKKWAAIPIRLIVGYGFMSHGYAKLARGPEHFAGILHTLGVPMPELSAWATVAIELLGGLAILIGAFVSLASIPMVIVMLTAMFTVHLQYGFSSIKLLAVTPAGAQFGPVGYEINLLYIACLVTLAVGGAGPLSVDKLRCNKRSDPEPAPTEQNAA